METTWGIALFISWGSVTKDELPLLFSSVIGAGSIVLSFDFTSISLFRVLEGASIFSAGLSTAVVSLFGSAFFSSKPLDVDTALPSSFSKGLGTTISGLFPLSDVLAVVLTSDWGSPLPLASFFLHETDEKRTIRIKTTTKNLYLLFLDMKTPYFTLINKW